MDKEAAPLDKHWLQKIMPSLDKNQRNATLKLNDSICSGIGGIVQQLSIIQMFHCTALRGFFGSFNETTSSLPFLMPKKTEQ